MLLGPPHALAPPSEHLVGAAPALLVDRADVVAAHREGPLAIARAGAGELEAGELAVQSSNVPVYIWGVHFDGSFVYASDMLSGLWKLGAADRD